MKVLLSSVLRSDNTPAFTSSLMFTEPTLFTVSQSLSWILRKGGQIMQKKRKKIPFHRTHTLLVTTIPAKHRGPQAGISLSSRGRLERPVVRTWFYGIVLYAAHTHTFGNSPSDSKCSSNGPTWGMPSVSHWNPDWPRGWVGKWEQTPQNLWATAVSLAVT